MRKLLITALVLIAILVTALPVHASDADYPPCGPYQIPSDSVPCGPTYIGGELLRLQPGVPFGWIRNAPSSYSAPVTTIQPSTYASIRVATLGTLEHFDGYQRWYKVTPYPLGGGVIGWIEQASLEAATIWGYPPDDPAVQAAWSPPLTGRVKPGIPFLWLRDDPDSHAGIRGTIPANGWLTIIGPAAFDGVQWWWTGSWTGRGFTFGWVEQAHIIAL